MRITSPLLAIVQCLLVHTRLAAPEIEPTASQTGEYLESGDWGLRQITNPPNASIDIVAVHGLDGHWTRSWTADNGVFWLRDLLPESLPEARIYAYSYDSRTRGGDTPLTLDISDHGRELVSELTLTRQLTNTEKRPIVFLGHSLGGIVVKSALLHSDMARVGHLESQRSIKLSTTAVIFLGTPHQGGRGVPIAQIVTRIMSSVSHTNPKLLDRMRPNSDWLLDLQYRYNAISQDFTAIYCYETLEMPLSFLGRLLIVPRYSAVVFGAVNSEEVSFTADHSTIVKYHNLEDPNFQKIAKRLQVLSMSATEQTRENWRVWEALKARPDPRLTTPLDSNSQSASQKEFDVGITFRAIWNRHFTGREETLRLLDEMLVLKSTYNSFQMVVLYGPGGAGKTHIALEYARRHQTDYTSIHWIDGSREDVIEISVETCVNNIRRHYESHGNTESPRYLLLNDTSSSHARDNYFKWLSHEDNNSWLLIIDNVDDLESVNFRELLPSASAGRIIVTSRRSDLAIN